MINDKFSPESAKNRVDNRKVPTSQGKSRDHFFSPFFRSENVAAARAAPAAKSAGVADKD